MAVNETVTVTLRRPVQAHGEALAAIALREPTGEDIMACGYPLTIVGDGSETRAEPQAAVIGRLIARLGGIPPSSVKALSAADWQDCMGAVLGFFGGSAAGQIKS